MAGGVQRLDLVDIDMGRGGMIRSRMGQVLGKDDVIENQFGVRVYRDGVPEDLTGATVTGYFTDSAGTRTVISGTASGNEAVVTLPDDCYEVAGIFMLAIKATQGGVTRTLRIVDGTVGETYYTTE